MTAGRHAPSTGSRPTTGAGRAHRPQRTEEHPMTAGTYGRTWGRRAVTAGTYGTYGTAPGRHASATRKRRTTPGGTR
jgi:hypothetical protein